MALSDRQRLFTSFASNAAGQAVPAVFSLVFTPLHVVFLGVETFGLLGFFIVLEQLLSIVTGGFSQAFQRAIVQAQAKGVGGLGPAHRKAAWIYALLGAGVAVFLSTAALPIAWYWLASPIDESATVTCLVLIALRIGLSLPWSIHQAVLLAMGRQEAFNAILVANMSVAGVAGVIVVITTASLPLYCLVQLLTSIVGLLIIRYEAQKSTRSTGDGAGIPMAKVMRESVHLIGLNACGLVMAAADRLAISRVQGPGLGIYNAASAPSRMLNQLLGALWVALLPRTCRIATIGEGAELTAHLRQTLAVSGSLILSVGVVAMFFSEAFLGAWIDDPLINEYGPAVMQWSLLAVMFRLIAGGFHLVRLAVHQESVAFYTGLVLLVPLIFGIGYGLQINGILGVAQALTAEAFIGCAVTVIHVLGWCLPKGGGRMFLLWPLVWRTLLSVGWGWGLLVCAEMWFPDSHVWQLLVGMAGGAILLVLMGAAFWLSEGRSLRQPSKPSQAE